MERRKKTGTKWKHQPECKRQPWPQLAACVAGNESPLNMHEFQCGRPAAETGSTGNTRKLRNSQNGGKPPNLGNMANSHLRKTARCHGTKTKMKYATSGLEVNGSEEVGRLWSPLLCYGSCPARIGSLCLLETRSAGDTCMSKLRPEWK